MVRTRAAVLPSTPVERVDVPRRQVVDLAEVLVRQRAPVGFQPHLRVLRDAHRPVRDQLRRAPHDRQEAQLDVGVGWTARGLQAVDHRRDLVAHGGQRPLVEDGRSGVERGADRLGVRRLRHGDHHAVHGGTGQQLRGRRVHRNLRSQLAPGALPGRRAGSSDRHHTGASVGFQSRHVGGARPAAVSDQTDAYLRSHRPQLTGPAVPWVPAGRRSTLCTCRPPRVRSSVRSSASWASGPERR